jgi:hypothetical protein
MTKLGVIAERRRSRQARAQAIERKKKEEEEAMAREMEQQWRIARDLREGEEAREREMKEAMEREQSAMAARLAVHRAAVPNTSSPAPSSALSAAAAVGDAFNNNNSGAPLNGELNYGPPVGLGMEGNEMMMTAPKFRATQSATNPVNMEGIPASSQFLARPPSIYGVTPPVNGLPPPLSTFHANSAGAISSHAVPPGGYNYSSSILPSFSMPPVTTSAGASAAAAAASAASSSTPMVSSASSIPSSSMLPSYVVPAHARPVSEVYLINLCISFACNVTHFTFTSIWYSWSLLIEI